MAAKGYDVLIVGAGIFGLSTAVALAERQYRVGILNPDSVPHHLAASTDISKIIRMEYGSDEVYFRMAETAIAGWKQWNELFEEEVYHETGFVLLCRDTLESDRQHFERHSYQMLQRYGYSPERWSGQTLKDRLPMFAEAQFAEGIYNAHAGYAESALAIEKLATYARSLGVKIHEQQTAEILSAKKGRVESIKTREGDVFYSDQVVVAAGAHTPYLVPELRPYMSVTGHPVFWLKPVDPLLFTQRQLPVFAADISNTGWYGFPLHPRHGVVKVARHAAGLAIHPDQDDRQVTADEMTQMRGMLRKCIPALANAPLVYTRRCLYTDTLDGHFWIDHHPEIANLVVATGGSGHAFKMGPVLGPMIADAMEGKRGPWSDRFRWRQLDRKTVQAEEARGKSES